MYRYFRLISIPLLFLISGLIMAMAVFFISTPYQDFTDALIAIYHLQEKAALLKSVYLTEAKYSLIKYMLISVALVVPLVGFYMFLNLELMYFSLKQFVSFLRGLFEKLKFEVDSLTSRERYLVIIALLSITLARIFFAFNYPLHIDEAFSYVFIVSKGWLATLSYYPGPNNHVAYLIFCSPFKLLFENPLIIMRAPAIMVSTSATIALFLILKKYFRFTVAFVSIILFSFSEYGIFYATHGRGYFLMLFFFVISFICLIRSITLGSRYYFILFCIASALGLYTIPVFVYPLASMLVAGIIYAFNEKNTRKIRWILISTSIIFLFTNLLYLPIIITNGYEALIGNRWVQSLSTNDFYQKIVFYLLDTPGTFYSLDIYGLWITLLNLFFWLIVALNPKSFSINTKINLSFVGWFVISFYLTPLILLILQQVIPGARTWLYLSLIEYTSIVLALKIILLKWADSQELNFKKFAPNHILVNRSFFHPLNSVTKLPVVIGILSIYTVCMVYYIHNFTLYQEKIYQSHPKITEKLIQEKPNKILVTHDLYNVFLRYEALKMKHHMILDTEQKDDRLLYDYVILKKNEDFPDWLNATMYSSFMQDDFVKVYKRKLITHRGY